MISTEPDDERLGRRGDGSGLVAEQAEREVVDRRAEELEVAEEAFALSPAKLLQELVEVEPCFPGHQPGAVWSDAVELNIYS